MDLSRFGSVLLTRWGAITDIGPVRSRNEDFWLVSPPLFAVADGMGDHMGGALASPTAVHALEDRLNADALRGRRTDLVDLSEGVRQAIQAVAAPVDPEDPMVASGSILTGILALDTEWGSFWLSFNVGGPCTYIVDEGSIRQVIRDHPTVQKARNLAELTGEELVFPPSNAVTRASRVGMAVVSDADHALIPLFRRDCALMCSDGVYSVLDDEMIVQIIRSGREPQRIASELVDVAITSDTHDNATAVVVHALCASWTGDAYEVHSRQTQAVHPAPTTIVCRGIN